MARTPWLGILHVSIWKALCPHLQQLPVLLHVGSRGLTGIKGGPVGVIRYGWSYQVKELTCFLEEGHRSSVKRMFTIRFLKEVLRSSVKRIFSIVGFNIRVCTKADTFR